MYYLTSTLLQEVVKLVKFMGLLRKEWLLYRSWWLVAILIGFIFVYCGEYFYAEQFEITNPRLLFTSWVMVISVFFVVIQFLTSIHNDLKTKEIWLHSTSSITQLVGVKFIFTLGNSMIFITIFSVIGLIDAIEFKEATPMQFLFLRLFMVTNIFIEQCSFILIVFLFLVFNIYLKNLFGRLAFIISVGSFILIMKLWTEFHESKLYEKIFYHGEISTDRLAAFLPQSYDSIFSMMESFYMVEGLAFVIGYLLLYILGTKWLEKVILR